MHIYTIAGALGALAGEFALRAGAEATGQALPTGDVTYVLSYGADGFLFGSDLDDPSTVWGMARAGALRAGLSPHNLPDLMRLVQRNAHAISNQLPFPPKPEVPEAAFPQEWSPNACPRFRADVLTLLAKHGLFDPDVITQALGVTIPVLFDTVADHCQRGDLDPGAMLQLVAEMMLATSRMVPLQAEI